MPRPRPAQAAATLAPVAVEAPFYIPATDAPSRPRRNLKHNDTFAVFDSHGDIGASAGGEDGLFDCDTRYLSHLELLFNGSQPLLLHSAINDNNLNYYVDLTNPDFYTDGKITLLKDTIHISRTIYLCEGSLRERIGLMNHGAEPVSFRLSLAFASDFADIFEVRGVRRSRRGQTWSEVLPPNGVHLSYRGLDSVVRQTTLHFEPAPTILQESVATYEIVLAPQEKRAVFVTAASRGRLPDPTTYFFRGLVALKRELKAATRHIASVETSNSLVNEVLCRSMADLYMLRTITQDGPYPYAGIPWYSTTFGRDGIITAMEMLWVDPAIAAGVLRRLARLQALKFDKQADAAPGKILHEMRAGEMAALGEVPFAQYYGTVDATPLFIMLAGQYLQRTGDLSLIRQIWPAIERALTWLDGPADIDGDGFIEYARGAQTGLSNQGWKDFARCRLPRRWSPRGGPDRAGRGAGLRVRRQTGRSDVRLRPWGLASRRPASRKRPSSCAAASRRRSGSRMAGSTRSRSTAARRPAGCGPAIRDRRWRPALSLPTAARWLLRRCWVRTSIRAGAFARSPGARRAITRCPTTTGRSGRTTTPCWRRASPGMAPSAA